jgi:hypothetical protein
MQGKGKFLALFISTIIYHVFQTNPHFFLPSFQLKLRLNVLIFLHSRYTLSRFNLEKLRPVAATMTGALKTKSEQSTKNTHHYPMNYFSQKYILLAFHTFLVIPHPI